MPTSEIAAITMVRDDYPWLEKWIAYYASHFGEENLYVILHGNDDKCRQIASSVNVLSVPVRQDDTVGSRDFDRDRGDLVAGLTEGLLRYYSHVLYTDVDEFIVQDPRLNRTLAETIASYDKPSVLSPFGLDVVHRRIDEPDDLDWTVPLLQQRSHCMVAPRYSKPVITNIPIEWSGGFHSSTHGTLTIPDCLFLFHLKWGDYRNSIETHYSRYMNKQNRNLDRHATIDVDSVEFPLREEVERTFGKFNALQVIDDDDFRFDDIKSHYRKTWRKRRYWAQKAFWKSLLRKDGRYLIYWRYDSTASSTLFKIPERLHELL